MQDLNVFLDDRLVGTLRQDDVGFLSFAYDVEYRCAQGSRPLSQSLPLADGHFDERRCQPFFAGLLPDSELTRATLGERFKVDKADDFGLLSNLGRDCAGAVVITPGHVRDMGRQGGWVEPLTEEVLAELIDSLPERPLFAEEEDVMLSLAGVHDKAAVYVGRDNVVSLPHKGYPSTHVLKVDIRKLPNSIKTEFFCLKVAKDMGLPAPAVRLRAAKGRVFMLVARYDRTIRVDATGNPLGITRLHQEDFCQAKGVLPRLKYEAKGGPDLKTMFDILRAAATTPAREVARLLDFVVFNFLIGNPDSHAKNYSLVYKPMSTELAPIYDVNNAAAFRRHYKTQRPRVAQAIGGEHDPTLVTVEHWDRLSADIRLNPRLVRKRLLDMARNLPGRARDRRKRLVGELADCAELEDVCEDVADRCARVVAQLETRAAPRPEPLSGIPAETSVPYVSRTNP